MKRLVAILAMLSLPLAVLGCSSDEDSSSEDAERSWYEIPVDPGEIAIGTLEDEGEILGEIYGQYLEEQGYDVVRVEAIGGYDSDPHRTLLEHLQTGALTFVTGYSATMLETIDAAGAGATGDPTVDIGLLQPRLAERGLQTLGPTGVTTRFTFVAAPDAGIDALSDLQGADDVEVYGPYDCESSPFCLQGLTDTYGMVPDFAPKEPQVLSDTLEPSTDAGSARPAIGVKSSVSGVDDGGLVTLDDDKAMALADTVVPVVSSQLVTDLGPQFVDDVDRLSAALTTETYAELNGRYWEDDEDPEDLATSFLADAGLIEAPATTERASTTTERATGTSGSGDADATYGVVRDAAAVFEGPAASFVWTFEVELESGDVVDATVADSVAADLDDRSDPSEGGLVLGDLLGNRVRLERDGGDWVIVELDAN